MVVQYYVFCQNIILLKYKMSWNNEDLDCYHARIYDSAKDKPTCGNGSFCVQKGTTRNRAGNECQPGEYCNIANQIKCPPSDDPTKPWSSNCPGVVPYMCEDTPNTEEECTGAVPDDGNENTGHTGGEYVWCKRDDVYKYDCGYAPDYCGVHGYCTENGCVCMPNFVPDPTSGKCVLDPSIQPGEICRNSHCPENFICTVPQDPNGKINIDRSALGYNCTYNNDDFCCPHYTGPPCEFSSNAHFSCQDRINKSTRIESNEDPSSYEENIIELPMTNPSYFNQVTWVEDPTNAGGLGMCVVGGKPMPTCKAVLKNDTHPPPQSFECSETEKKCVRILDRSGEYVELKDCLDNCKF